MNKEKVELLIENIIAMDTEYSSQHDGYICPFCYEECLSGDMEDIKHDQDCTYLLAKEVKKCL